MVSPDEEWLWPAFSAAVRDYALLLLDTDGHVMSWNRGAELASGYQAEEIVGRHLSRLYSPEDVANGRPERELQIAAATGRFADVGQRMRKDGSRFPADVVITAIRDPDGALRLWRDLPRYHRPCPSPGAGEGE
jgi:PAS domain S-box-containing protein